MPESSMEAGAPSASSGLSRPGLPGRPQDGGSSFGGGTRTRGERGKSCESGGSGRRRRGGSGVSGAFFRWGHGAAAAGRCWAAVRMCESYSRWLLRVSVAQVCQALGWDSVQLSACDLLTDVLQRYLHSLGRGCRRYCELYGRTDPILEDPPPPDCLLGGGAAFERRSSGLGSQAAAQLQQRRLRCPPCLPAASFAAEGEAAVPSTRHGAPSVGRSGRTGPRRKEDVEVFFGLDEEKEPLGAPGRQRGVETGETGESCGGNPGAAGGKRPTGCRRADPAL
ncbi:transcription initiation factor TFIID subunit 3 [Rhineura floridana]|uniref:transcription initiation factor TFIID subunit 3 n=1 Tax=Rhineura floridana TaxID=261503 RepID=UPI002AC84165|nr:transcription initiation factor TFIID subunit 3 [Rhineura floridana]